MKEIYYKNKLTAVGNHIKLKKYQDFDAGTRTGLTLEETPDGRIIKSISFKIPVFYEDWVPKKELIADDVITYTLDTSEAGITSAEAKATYVELKKYILDRYGAKVSSLYIAQIKRKYGIDMGENYNKPDDPNKRVPKCPKAKEEMIIEALKHFKMLEPDVKMIA